MKCPCKECISFAICMSRIKTDLREVEFLREMDYLSHFSAHLSASGKCKLLFKYIYPNGFSRSRDTEVKKLFGIYDLSFLED